MIPIKSSATKLNKKQAYQVVQRARAGEELSSGELDSLLLYFAPAMPAKAKTALQWLSKAAARQDVRTYLEYIWVDDKGIGYATNGHVAHRARVAVAPGYYCPKTLLPADGVGNRYPDVNRVFPNDKVEKIHSINIDALDVVVTSEKLTVYKWGEYHVNKRYIDAAVNGDTLRSVNLVKPALSHNKNPTCTYTGLSEFGDWVVMGCDL